MKIKYIAKKILGRDKIKSIGRNYWEKAASGKMEKTMKRICDGFDRETFEGKRESIIFSNDFSLSPSAKVLELACGVGRTCRWVAPYVEQYVGVDFIPEMIEKAKSYNAKYTNAQFIVNDGKTLKEFSDETFDTVYCELAFQHMTKDVQESYVREVYRVLKKDGTFLAQLPRIEFYNDPVFALSREEADKLLRDFHVTFTEIIDPYYVVKAIKSSTA